METSMQSLITLKEVESLTTLKRSKIYQMIKEGQFPTQVKISSNRSAWLECEIQKWIVEKAKSRSLEVV